MIATHTYSKALIFFPISELEVNLLVTLRMATMSFEHIRLIEFNLRGTNMVRLDTK